MTYDEYMTSARKAFHFTRDNRSTARQRTALRRSRAGRRGRAVKAFTQEELGRLVALSRPTDKPIWRRITDRIFRFGAR